MTKPADNGDGNERDLTDEELDERFMLKGDPEEALRKLLSVRVPIEDEPDDA